MRDTEVDKRSRSADAEMNIGTALNLLFHPLRFEVYIEDEDKVPPHLPCTTKTLHGIISQQTQIFCRHFAISMTVRMCISVPMALYI